MAFLQVETSNVTLGGASDLALRPAKYLVQVMLVLNTDPKCLLVRVLPQVALRRVLQVIDPKMPDAEASRYIVCSQVDNVTDW
jgi:hypothetical protein